MADPQLSYPFVVCKDDAAAIPVNAWSKMLLSPETLPTSQSYIVQKAYHCKCVTSKDHEFVVVVFGSNGKIISFFMDRGEGDNPARSSSSLICVPAVPNGSSHDVCARSIQLSSAKDCVHATPDGSEDSIFARAKAVHGPYTILSTFETSANTNTMNAAHVAILLHTVSQLQPQYDANSSQCYWFAHSVFQVIKSVTNSKEEPKEHSDMRGKYHFLPVIKREKSKAIRQGDAIRSKSMDQVNTEGRSDNWKKLARMTPGQGPDVKAVLDAYNIAVTKEKKIWGERASAAEQARRNELDAKRVDEERKKAVAAEKIAAAAEKMAADEKAAAAAAKHNEEIAKQTAAAAEKIAADERAAAAAAKRNEEIAKQKAEDERLKAEDAAKRAAELEETIRALKAQLGMQESM